MAKLATWLARQATAVPIENGLLVTLRQAQTYTKIDCHVLLECFKVLDEHGVVTEIETKRRDSHQWIIPDVKRVGDFAKFYEATIMEGEQC